MRRRPSRLLVPALALIALAFLFPTFASALPQREAVLSAAERPEAGPGLFSKIQGLLSVLWAETGSGLDPNGTGSGPNTASTGDTGSGLDPDGRH
jgi:hypothetical protein